MIERGSAVPSSMPSRLDSEPAATLRTTTSSGMISTSRISCSRMLSRRMKWVGTPISPSFGHQIFGDAVVEDALALDRVVLLVVEGGGVVLEILDERAGLGALVEDLGLAFVDFGGGGSWLVPHSGLASDKRQTRGREGQPRPRATCKSPLPESIQGVLIDLNVREWGHTTAAGTQAGPPQLVDFRGLRALSLAPTTAAFP